MTEAGGGLPDGDPRVTVADHRHQRDRDGGVVREVGLDSLPFQVTSRDGPAPVPFDAGRKDTVDVPPSETVEVAVRFTGHRGLYMLYCHDLEHEDMAMMADFAVERRPAGGDPPPGRRHPR